MVQRTEYTGVDLPDEIWADVFGYEGLYKISNMGRIRSLPKIVVRARGVEHLTKDLIMTPGRSKGYRLFSLQYNKKKRVKGVHILVGEIFVYNPENKPYINHKNGVKDDNRAVNLEWSTQKENVIHAFENGLATGRKGVANNQSKLTEQDVLLIRGNYNIETDIFDKIGALYNVSGTCIKYVIKNKSWNHVI